MSRLRKRSSVLVAAVLLTGVLASVSQAAPRSSEDSRPQSKGESKDKGESRDKGESKDKEVFCTVALVGDYNYGCDLNVKVATVAAFVQGKTVPKCAGPLVDDRPVATGIQIPGRQKSNNMINSINAAGVAFTIHDGDTKSGSTECRESIHDGTKAQFNGQPINGAANPGYNSPIVYTPGDNEWTDCHRFAATQSPVPANLTSIPLDNLAAIRTKFFSAPLSLGKTTMSVNQQAGYPENLRWQRGPVLYLTINMPGSNNNFCSPLQSTLVCNQNGEADSRNASNIAWIKAAFKLADESDAKAIVVTAQGNPNFERNAAIDLPTYDMNGYVDFLTTMREQTRRFEGQVVYVHGDSHSAMFDHPLMDTTGSPLPNFTRIETSGKEDTHWVKMTVNPGGPVLLSFELQVIDANLGSQIVTTPASTVAQTLPWNVTALPVRLDLPRFDD